MSQGIRLASLVLLVLSVHCSQSFAWQSSPEPRTVLPKVRLQTLDNKLVRWEQLAGEKATVILFLSFDCPMCRNYLQALNEQSVQYGKLSVHYVGIIPTNDEPMIIAQQVDQFKLSFPVLKDHGLRITNLVSATTTPEVVLLNRNSEICYRGLIDDAYSKRLVLNKRVNKRYLIDAIEALISETPVPIKSTEPIGCKISPIRTQTAAANGPTYHRDVAPILQKHCQSCHRPGGAGPFPLLTYKQALTWSDDIQEFTRNRQMPPWKPRGGLEFVGDRRLTGKEIDTLTQWVKGGCLEGDPNDAPKATADLSEWPLGKPDLILEMPDDFILGPTGRDHYRVVVLPTGLKEDRYLTAVDVRPGNANVVHHAVNLFDTTGSARRQQARHEALESKLRNPTAVDIGPGFPSGMLPGIRLNPVDLFARVPPYGPLGGWAPGMMPQKLPVGTGFFLPKDSDFLMQLHYHRIGRIEKDRTKVGLYFAGQPVERPVLTVVIPGYFKPAVKSNDPLGYIPAGDANCRGHGTWYVLEDCTLLAVMPHMHLLGKSIKITFTRPGQQTETLIDIPEWDFNWQELYYLKQPLKVPAGTRFDIEGIFDNSASNPNNPNDPPIDVRFGEQTTDEMLFGFLYATKDDTNAGLPHVILQGPVKLSR